MCLEQPNQAEFFLLNKESYTETKNINFSILNIDDLLQEINVGKPRITKKGSLELNKYVGIQRKGSGGLSQKNNIQFTDRGFNNLFKVMSHNIHNKKKMKGLSLFAYSDIAEYYLD